MNTFTITIAGLPRACAYCGHQASHWPLSYGRNVVTLVCESCYSLIGTLVAVPPPGDDRPAVALAAEAPLPDMIP